MFGTLVQDAPGGVGNRSVTFTDANVTVAGGVPLTSNGVAVTFVLSAGNTVLTGVAGGRTVFEVSLSDDGTGKFRFVLLDQLDHAANGNENDIALTFNYTATDSDGDAVSSQFVVSVDDDVPVVVQDIKLGGTVDEDGVTELPDGASPGDGIPGGPDDVAGENTVVAGFVTALFQSGADEPLSYSLSSDVSSLLGQNLTSNGIGLSYSVVNNVLTATAPAGNTIFTFSVDPSSGEFTFTLVDQLDHPTLDGLAGDNTENDLTIGLGAIVQATDQDGDTVAAPGNSVQIVVNDDTPTVNAASICAPPTEDPGSVANFVLVLDTSGSIDDADQLDLIKDAVDQLLNQLGGSQAQAVRVHIVQFDEHASSVGTYDLIVGGQLNTNALAEAIADVGALTSDGSTNYEAGLQQALQFIQGYSPTLAVNSVVSSHDANSPDGDNDTARIIGNGTTQIALVSAWTSPGANNSQLLDVNGSNTNGWGAGNNDQVDAGQMLRFDFGSFDSFGVSNFVSGGFNGIDVVSATFDLDDNSSGSDTDYSYKIVFVGGGQQTGTHDVDGSNDTITLAGTGANAGKQIAYVEFAVTGNDNSGDIDLVSVIQPPVPPGTLPNADVNSLIFISDGQPNTANNDSGGTISVGAQAAIDQILGNTDSSNEVGQTEGDGDAGGPDQAFTIEAFLVGSPTMTRTIDDADDSDVNGSGSDDDGVLLRSDGTAIALVSGWSSSSLALDQLVDANGGTSGVGVQGGSNSQLDATEVLRFDFGPGTDYDGAGNNYSTVGFNGPPILSASFEFDDFGNANGHAVGYRVFYTDGSSDPGFTTVGFNTDSRTQVINAPTGKFIDYIEFVNTGTGNGQIDLQSVVTPNSALALLSQVEGTGGAADSITTADDLTASLNELIASLGGGQGEDCGPIVVHDETNGVQNADDPNGQDDVTGGMLVIGTTTIASLFAGVTPAGGDPHATLDNGAIGFARSGAGVSPINFVANFGADGPAAGGGINHVLSISGVNGGVYSGVNTTDGHEIYLFKQADGLIVGRVDINDDHSASATDPAAFAIAVNPATGELYVAHYLSLDHPLAGSGTNPPGSHDEVVRLLDNAIQITVEVTDFDGDTVRSDAVNIGRYIGFQDDGPTALVGDTRTVDEDDLDISGNTPQGNNDVVNASDDVAVNALSSVFGSFGVNFGSDGPAATNAISGVAFTPAVTSDGDPVSMVHGVGNNWIGQASDGRTVFTLDFNVATGQYTFTLLDNLDHPVGDNAATGANESTEDNLVVDFTFVATDADSDTVNGSFAVNVDDDMPVTTPVTTVGVDEDGLTLANSFNNADGIGDSTQIGDAPSNSPVVTQSLGIKWGADDNDDVADDAGIQDAPGGTGDRSLTFTDANVTINGVASLMSNRDPVDFAIIDGGTRLVGYVNSGGVGYSPGERLVFEVTLSDEGTGSFTFTLRDNIDHAPGVNENDISLSFNYKAKDSDGDTATGSFLVNVDDDMPVAGLSLVQGAQIRLDETNGETPNGDDTTSDGFLARITVQAANLFVQTIDFGADGPLDVNENSQPDAGAKVFSLDLLNTNTGLIDTVSGLPITLSPNGTTIEGKTSGGDIVFTIAIDASNGNVTVTQLRAIQHDDPNDPDESSSPASMLVGSVSIKMTLSDDDLDTASASVELGSLIKFEDDGPTMDGKVCLTSGTGVSQYGANPADMIYAIPPGTGLTIEVTDFAEGASFDNSLGYYFLDAAGQPISGVIIEDNVADNSADRTITIPAGSIPPGAVMLGFFIIPDGNDLNDGTPNHNLADGNAITFQQVGGNWVAFYNGSPLSSAEGHVLFSDRRLNPDISPDGNPTPGDDFDHNTSNGTTSNGNWEDTTSESDLDFDDVEFSVEVCATPEYPDHGRRGRAFGCSAGWQSGAASGRSEWLGGGDNHRRRRCADRAGQLRLRRSARDASDHACKRAHAAADRPEVARRGHLHRLGWRCTDRLRRERCRQPWLQRGHRSSGVHPHRDAARRLHVHAIDQIDHPTLDGQNPGDNSENLLATAIDLSGYIIAMDGDDDSIPLACRHLQGAGARRHSCSEQQHGLGHRR